MRLFSGLILSFCFFITNAYSGDLKSRFGGQDTLSYRVYFNAIPSGSIKWSYQGESEIEKKLCETVYFESNTKILGLFDFGGKDKIFLERVTLFPIRVERDLSVSGTQERITEDYNQEEGSLKITKTSKGKISETLLRQDKPIRHIMALLFFLPDSVKFQDGFSEEFNLPTQKVTIKFKSNRELTYSGKKRKCFFLRGSGAKSFNIWIDEETRQPLRLEFYVGLGKVSIVAQPPVKTTGTD